MRAPLKEENELDFKSCERLHCIRPSWMEKRYKDLRLVNPDINVSGPKKLELIQCFVDPETKSVICIMKIVVTKSIKYPGDLNSSIRLLGFFPKLRKNRWAVCMICGHGDPIVPGGSSLKFGITF